MAIMSQLSDRYVTREFNHAFQFLQIKAEKVEIEDDVIDTGLKKILLDLFEDQRQQVQRAWLSKSKVLCSEDGEEKKVLAATEVVITAEVAAADDKLLAEIEKNNF